MAKKQEKIELLAPAGNLEKLETAVVFGADAVYAGIPAFSLRVRINDFDLEKLREAAVFCHERDKRIYVTINIFAHNRHFASLPGYVKELKKIGVDALIISDPGVLMAVKKIWPEAEIHLSTQANCTNAESAAFWHNAGVSRVILGREVALDDIRKIKERCPGLALEYFVHGAMCMSYSGRCFLSKFFLGRSANLGDCIQPCRWNYFLSEEKRPGLPLELVEEEHGSYILNSKDLCLIEYLQELIEAGVSCFKIEGRAKSVYYQAMVTGIYRQALDTVLDGDTKSEKSGIIKMLKHELETKLVHRGYTTGFLLGNEAEQNMHESHVVCAWEYCGQVTEAGKSKDQNGKKTAVVKVHNSLRVDDEIEIVGPYYDIIKMKVKKLTDHETNKDLTEAHGGQDSRVILETTKRLAVGAVIRRRLK